MPTPAPLKTAGTVRSTARGTGALWKANSNTSIFVRASKGGRFNADRQTLSGKFTAAGQLNANGIPAAVDYVNQYELGLKNRGRLGGGRYTVELTLLKGDFKQSTYELSATRCPGGAGGCIIDAAYKSSGAELYATYQVGGFSLVANATYSQAQRRSAGTAAYTRSPGISDLTYTVSANYDFGDLLTLGLNTSGQTSQVDDGGNVYPGAAIFGASVRVRPIKNLELGMQAYNLFDKFDLRGNGGLVDTAVNPTVVSGAPAIGRTFIASVKYSF